MYNNNNLILITMDSITNYETVRKCLLELLVLPKIIKFTKKLSSSKIISSPMDTCTCTD